MEQFGYDKLNDVGLQVDNEVRQQLNESSKWAKFISITMFSFCGVMLLVGVVASTAITGVLKKVLGYDAFGYADTGIIIGIILIVVAIVAIVYYFLYNFSAKIKAALVSEDNEKLNAGISSLKIFFIISAIGSIITLLASVYNLLKTQF